MKNIISIIIIFSVFLVGCDTKTMNSEIYQGQELIIAVVGDLPEIREENIDFESVSLEEISTNIEQISNKFDALFIMSEFFSIADDDKYINTYQDLTIPTFFIGTTKAHLPFVTEHIRYETAPEVSEELYAAGYLYYDLENGPKVDTWRYYLNQDVKTSKEVFTIIFKTIDELD